MRAPAHDAHVLVVQPTAFADAVHLAHLGKVEKNAFRGAARRGEELADQLRFTDSVAGLLQGLTDDRLLRGLANVDHSGHGFRDPSVGGCWIVAAPRDQGRHLLWKRLEFVEEAGCHLWVQNLYGHHAPHMGAVHGFAGNAFAVIRGWHLLSDPEQSRWADRLADSLRRTARLEDDCATWPQSLGQHRPGRT